MKAILLLPAAYLAAGFVIPGQDSIESLIGFSFDTHHAISESLFNEHEEEPAPSASYTEELANNLEIVSELALYPPQTPHPSYPEGFVKQTGDNDFDLDSNTDDLRTRGHCHHGNRNKTTYQLLTSGKKTSLFGKLISEFDDIVNLLNSTDKSHTVLVPRDKVLKRAMHHHVPKEYVKKFIEYHILAEPKTARDIYHSRTIRTVLEQDELGDHDQRISTQFGITGLTINYISHIVMANLVSFTRSPSAGQLLIPYNEIVREKRIYSRPRSLFVTAIPVIGDIELCSFYLQRSRFWFTENWALRKAQRYFNSHWRYILCAY